MTEKTKADALTYLKSIVQDHLPAKARQYKYKVCLSQVNINPTLGMQFDLQPVEGKVVDGNDDWVVLKIGQKSEFFLCDVDLLEEAPELGSLVRITPYARRKFDGTRLEAPTETKENGIVIQSFVLGERISKLPIDVDSLKSEYLKDLINQVERLPAPDGIRTLAQVLIDAGAAGHDVAYKDPADSEVLSMPPTLEFNIKTMKHEGYLRIVYDRGMDYYVLQLIERISRYVVYEIKDVAFVELPERIVDLIDDDTWRIAKLEVLKPAPKNFRKAA